MDTLARALLVAASMIEDGSLEQLRDERYAGWDGELGQAILDGDARRSPTRARVCDGEIDPQRDSGHQEMLENLVNRHIWAVERRPTESTAALSMALVLGIDVSTTATRPS